jgi:nucleotide-binding universal stress UspA family protein
LAQKIVEQAVAFLAGQGYRVTSAIREGEPRQELLREARRFKANSLFLGSRGLGAVKRFFLGSVSLSIAGHAPCTVEVVRG